MPAGISYSSSAAPTRASRSNSNVSSGGSSGRNGNSGSRYRYSHDELVSFFNQAACRPPKELQECEELFKPEPHKPMALLGMTAEEQEFYKGLLPPPPTPKYPSGVGGVAGMPGGTPTEPRKFGNQNGTNGGGEDYDYARGGGEARDAKAGGYDIKAHNRANNGAAGGDDGGRGGGLRSGQTERKLSGNSGGYSHGNGPASPSASGGGGQFIMPGLRRGNSINDRPSGNGTTAGGGGAGLAPGSRPPGFRAAPSLFNRMSSYDETSGVARSNTLSSLTGGKKTSRTEGGASSSAAAANMANTFVPTWRKDSTSTTSSSTSTTNTTSEAKTTTEWRSETKTWRTEAAGGAGGKTPSGSKTSLKDSTSYSLGDMPPETMEFIQRKQRQAQAAAKAGITPGKGSAGGGARGRGFEDDLFKRDGFDPFLDGPPGAEPPRDFFSSGQRSTGDSFRSKQPPGFSRYSNQRDRDDRGYEFGDRAGNWGRAGAARYGNNNQAANEGRDPREPPRYQPMRYFNRERGEYYRPNDRRAPTAGGGVPDEDERYDGGDDDYFRRDSLPEWSLDDAVSLDVTKVGTFDASGAFHEAIDELQGENNGGEKTEKKRNTSESEKAGQRERKTSELDATTELGKKLEFMMLNEDSAGGNKAEYRGLFGSETKPEDKSSVTGTTTSKGMFYGFDDDAVGNDFMAKYLSETEKEHPTTSEQKPASLEANKNFLNERFQQFRTHFISQQQTKQHSTTTTAAQDTKTTPTSVDPFGARNGQLFDEDLKQQQQQPPKLNDLTSAWNTKPVIGQEFFHDESIKTAAISSSSTDAAFGMLSTFNDFGLAFGESSGGAPSSAASLLKTDEQDKMTSAAFSGAAKPTPATSLGNSFGIDGMIADIGREVIFANEHEQQKKQPTPAPGPIGAPKVAPSGPAPPPNATSIALSLYMESLKWYYCDPHQNVQGPFQANEMNDWYVSGYFPSALNVRRGCDQTFFKLIELISVCGELTPFPLPRLPFKDIEMVLNSNPEISLEKLIFPPPVPLSGMQGIQAQLARNKEMPPVPFPGPMQNHPNSGHPQPVVLRGEVHAAAPAAAPAQATPAPAHQPWQGFGAGGGGGGGGGPSAVDICNLPGIQSQPNGQVQQQIRLLMSMIAAKDPRFLELTYEQQYNLALEHYLRIKQLQQQQTHETEATPSSQPQPSQFGAVPVTQEPVVEAAAEPQPPPMIVKAIPLEEIEKQQQHQPPPPAPVPNLDPVLQTIPGVAWAGALSLSDVEELQRREAEEKYRATEKSTLETEQQQKQQQQQAKHEEGSKKVRAQQQQQQSTTAKSGKQAKQKAKEEAKINQKEQPAVEAAPPSPQPVVVAQQQQQQPQPQVLSELQLPKKSVWGNPTVAAEQPPAAAPGQALTLVEIQKLQEEKEEEEKRKLQQQMADFIASQQAQQSKSGNKWGTSGWQTEVVQVEQVKTLAEIQAEEARLAKLKREAEERRRTEAGMVAATAGSTPLSVIVAKGGGLVPATGGGLNGTSVWGGVATQPSTALAVEEPPSESADPVKPWLGKNGKVDALLLKKHLKSNPKNVRKLEVSCCCCLAYDFNLLVVPRPGDSTHAPERRIDGRAVSNLRGHSQQVIRTDRW